jgi:hypothetical protein
LPCDYNFLRICTGDFVAFSATPKGPWKRARVLTDPVRDYRNIMLASVFLIDEGVEPDKFFNVRQRMRPCPEHLKPGMIRQRAFKGRDLTFLGRHLFF